MTGLLLDVAQHLASPRSFSALALERAQNAVIDTLACMIAGAQDGSVQAVAKAFESELAAGGGQWLVAGGKTTASVAALINGTAAHALDFDDNFHPARAHASAVLVPALLAAARVDVGGRRLMEAYLTGLEAQAAIGFGVNPSHYNRGWHGTSTVGAIGAAAGVARLLGADIGQTAQAMSLSISMACGPKGQFGTVAKPLHAGIAARNAVEAARLALAGVTGRLDILERPQGFLDLCGGDEPSGWAAWHPGESHVIETHGLVTKRHPCCASTHRAIDALLDLRHEHKLAAADIAHVDVKVGLSAARNLAYPDPENEMQARFSMQYCLATAMLRESLSLSDFTAAAVARADVRTLMPRITMHAYTAEEERGHERLPHIVTVTLCDGNTLRRQRLHAKGSIQDPLDAGLMRRKLAGCVEWSGRAVTHDLYDQLSDFAQVTSVPHLLNTL
jgi:2-methylcitrate dehydratase PrpD